MAVRMQNQKLAYITQANGTTIVGTSAEFFGTSSDTKPTQNLVNGSTFLEVDTGKIYLFNETTSSWVELQ